MDNQEIINRLAKLGTSIHITKLPFIIPVDDDVHFIECKCGLRVLKTYKTCPACGREIEKVKK